MRIGVIRRNLQNSAKLSQSVVILILNEQVASLCQRVFGRGCGTYTRSFLADGSIQMVIGLLVKLRLQSREIRNLLFRFPARKCGEVFLSVVESRLCFSGFAELMFTLSQNVIGLAVVLFILLHPSNHLLHLRGRARIVLSQP